VRIGACAILDSHKITAAELSITIYQSLVRQSFVSSERRAKDQLLRENSELVERCKIAQEYAGHVSHQVRTPLTVIKAFAAIFANSIAGQLNTKQTEHLQKIIDQTDRLNDMLSQMLENATSEIQHRAKDVTIQSARWNKYPAVQLLQIDEQF